MRTPEVNLTDDNFKQFLDHRGRCFFFFFSCDRRKCVQCWKHLLQADCHYVFNVKFTASIDWIFRNDSPICLHCVRGVSVNALRSYSKGIWCSQASMISSVFSHMTSFKLCWNLGVFFYFFFLIKSDVKLIDLQIL